MYLHNYFLWNCRLTVKLLTSENFLQKWNNITLLSQMNKNQTYLTLLHFIMHVYKCTGILIVGLNYSLFLIISIGHLELGYIRDMV